jgi:hypothetical protein
LLGFYAEAHILADRRPLNSTSLVGNRSRVGIAMTTRGPKNLPDYPLRIEFPLRIGGVQSRWRQSQNGLLASVRRSLKVGSHQGPQPVEARPAVIVTAHRLTVDDARPGAQFIHIQVDRSRAFLAKGPRTRAQSRFSLPEHNLYPFSTCAVWAGRWWQPVRGS